VKGKGERGPVVVYDIGGGMENREGTKRIASKELL